MSTLDELLEVGGQSNEGEKPKALMPPARGFDQNPRGVGHTLGSGKLSDNERLDVLIQQRDDPDRTGTFDSQLEQEIKGLSTKLGRTQKAIERNRAPEPEKQKEQSDADLGLELVGTFGSTKPVKTVEPGAYEPIGAGDPDAGMPPSAPPGGAQRAIDYATNALRPVDRTQQNQRIAARQAGQTYPNPRDMMDSPGPFGGGERQQRATAQEANRRASEDFWRNMGSYAQSLGPQMRQTMGGAMRALGEYLQGEQSRYEAEHQGPGLLLTPEQKANAQKLIDMGTSFYETGDIASKDAMMLNKETPMRPSIAAQAIGSAGQSIAQMAVPMLAGTLSGGAPTVLTLMGLQTFSQEYGHGRDEGLTPKQAAVYAGIYGALEVGTEFAPVRALMAKNPHMASWFWNFLVREVPSEMLATATQSALEKVSVTPEMTWQDFQQAMLTTILSTPLAAGAQAGAVRAIHGREPFSEEQRQKVLDDYASELAKYRAKAEETKGFTQPEAGAQESGEKVQKSVPPEFSPTHRLDDIPVVQHTEDGEPVEGIWRDQKGGVHEAPRAEPIQAPAPNATWNLSGTDYDVEVIGKGKEKGTARLLDGQEVPIAELRLEDEAKVKLGLAPAEGAAKAEKAAPGKEAEGDLTEKAAAPQKGARAEPPPPRGSEPSLRPAQPAMAALNLTPSEVAAHNKPVLEGIGSKNQRIWYDDQGAIVGVGRVNDVSNAVAKLGGEHKVYMADLKFKEGEPTEVVPHGDFHPEADEKLRQAIGAPNVHERKAARAEQMRQEGLDRKKIDVDRDTLTQAIIKLGGIKASERLDIIGDDKGNKTIPFVGHLFTKNGDTLDGLVRKLEEYGYIQPGEEDDIRTLADKVRAEYEGHEEHHSIRRSHEAIGREEEERYRNEMERERDMADKMEGAVDVELEHNVAPEEFTDEFKATPERMAAVDLLRQLPEDVGEDFAMQNAELSDEDFLAALEAAVKEHHEKAESKHPQPAQSGVRAGSESGRPAVRGSPAAHAERASEGAEQGSVRREAKTQVAEQKQAKYKVADPTNDEAIQEAPASTLVLMACSSTKGDSKAALFDLYEGPLWQTLRKYIGEIPKENVVVLSGKHGWASSSFEADPYNEKLTPEKADELIAQGVPQKLIEHLTHDDGKISNVVIVGSEQYRRVFNAAVAELDKAGHLDEQVAIPAIEGGIGSQRKQLGDILEAVNTPREDDEEAQPEGGGDLFGNREQTTGAVYGADRPMRGESKADMLLRRQQAEEEHKKREVAYRKEFKVGDTVQISATVADLAPESYGQADTGTGKTAYVAGTFGKIEKITPEHFIVRTHLYGQKKEVLLQLDSREFDEVRHYGYADNPAFNYDAWRAYMLALAEHRAGGNPKELAALRKSDYPAFVRRRLEWFLDEHFGGESLRAIKKGLLERDKIEGADIERTLAELESSGRVMRRKGNKYDLSDAAKSEMVDKIPRIKEPQGEPAFDLTEPTEKAPPPEVGPEEQHAAVRDRNEAILTPPAGTAPAAEIKDEDRQPTQQLSLFQRGPEYWTGVDRAAAQASGDTASEAQQGAGNYEKGHAQIGPEGSKLDISFENTAGTSRNPAWPPLQDHYGYIKGSMGYDKDHLDVFVVPGTLADYSGWVYVINQAKADGSFDEHKALIGVQGDLTAVQVYQRNYEPGWDRLMSVIPMTWDGFRAWSQDQTRKGPKGGPLTMSNAARFDRDVAGAYRQEQAKLDFSKAVTLPSGEVKSFEHIVTKVVKQRTIKLPSGRINSPMDAARAFLQLQKFPREMFHMIGVDAKGRPVAYYELGKGSLRSVDIPPREVWAVLYGTEGVKGVWLAHNHPSGTPTPSAPDERITEKLRTFLTPAVGVDYLGHVIIAGNQAFAIGEGPLGEIPATEAKRSVPVMEREIVSDTGRGPTVTSPADVRAFLKEYKPDGPGLLVVDTQHRVTGYWNMPLERMAAMEPGKFGAGAAEVLRLIGRNNPSRAFLYSPDGSNPVLVQAAARNMRAMLDLADIGLLDAFSPGQNGQDLLSYAERGLMQRTGKYEYSLDLRGAPEGITADAARAELENHPLYKQLGDRVQVVPGPLHLPAHKVAQLIELGGLGLVRGTHDSDTGRVYLVASNLRAGEAQQILLHEAVGHAGILDVLGPEMGDVMRDIYRSRAAEIRREAENGFLAPYKLDLRNSWHQAQAAAEYVAHMAERGEEQTLWAKFVAAVRDILRKLGFVRQWSDADILNLLQLSRSALIYGGADTYNGRPWFSLGQPGPVWYSALERAVEALQLNRATGQQWLGTINSRPGIKPAEMEWSGLREWLATQEGPVEKEAVLRYLRENGVQLGERAFGSTGDHPLLAERDRLVEQLEASGYDVEWMQDGDFGYLHRRSTGGDMFFFPEDNEALRRPKETLDDLTTEYNEWLTERNAVVTARVSADDLLRSIDAGVKPFDQGQRSATMDEQLYIREFMRRWDDAGLRDDVHDINELAEQQGAPGREIVEAARRLRDIAPETAHMSEGSGATRWSTYTLPGGDDYKELLITLPRKPDEGGWSQVGPGVTFQSSHFDEPNILAHVRFKTRKDAEGKRVLFVEEIQSDWAEQGRRRGFREDVNPATRDQLLDQREKLVAELNAADVPARNAVARNDLMGFDSVALALGAFRTHQDWERRWGDGLAPVDIAAIDAYVDASRGIRLVDDRLQHGPGVSKAPFVQNTQQWTALVLKRVVRYAADNGFDRVAWTTGNQQVARFRLSSHVDRLTYFQNRDGSPYGEPLTYNVHLHTTAGRRAAGGPEHVVKNALTETALRELVGDAIANKIVNNEGASLDDRWYDHNVYESAGHLTGVQLEVGGEGMREYYDKIVPNVANDVIKKLGGARVGTVPIAEHIAPQGNYIERSTARSGYLDVVYADGTVYGSYRTRDEANDAMAKLEELSPSPKPVPTVTMTNPGFDVTEAMRLSAARGMPMFSLRGSPKSVNEVYGVRDGRLLGMATKVGGTAWEVYLATGTNESMFAKGQFRRAGARSLNEVNRIFNRNGLEMRVVKPRNIPVPDRAIFDRNWVAPSADTWLRRSIIYFQNRLLLPELYERTISKEVGPIPDAAQAHREARIAHPRAAGKIADFDHEYTEPIVGLMQKYGLGLKDVGEFLYATHAPERNAAIEAINPDNFVGSGMSNERAEAILNSFRADPKKWEGLNAIRQYTQAITRFREQQLIDKGLAKPEVIAQLQQKYPNYVPLKEISEDEYANSEIGGGYRVGRMLNAAFGRFTEAQAQFILPGLISQAKGTIAAGENAEVLRAFLKLVSYAPNQGVWNVERYVWKPYLDKDTGELQYAPRPTQMVDRTHVIAVPVAGDRHHVRVADERLATAFNSSGLPLGDALQLIGTMTRFYALMATSANPEFIAVNFMRDFQQAMIRLTGEQNVEMAAKVAKDVIPALWGAFSGLRAKGQYVPGQSAKPGAEGWHAWYRRFIEAGGHVAYRGMQDVETQHKDFLVKLAEAGIYPDAVSSFQKVRLKGHRTAKVMGAKWFSQLIVDANGAVENALRLSTFKNAVEAGWNEKDAAMLARSVTVDFNLKGDAGTRIGALYMFFNANVQGSALLFRSVVNNRAIKGAAVVLFLLGMLFDWWNRKAANEDRNGRSQYDNIGYQVKDRNFVLMGPDGESAITVPLPFGFNIFYLAGVNAMAVMPKGIGGAGKRPLEAAGDMFGTVVNALSPFGQSPTSLLGALQLVSPTFADPAVQAMTNRNFMDKPIKPERPKYAPPQSDSSTYFAGTPDLYVDIAQYVNEATGGNEVRSGLVDISPNMLRHWVQSIFGSAGAFVARVGEAVGQKASGKESEVRNLPFVRRFYYEPKDYELSRRFYEYVHDAEVAHFEVLRRMQQGDSAGASSLRQEFKLERSMHAEAAATEQSVAKIRQQIAVVRRDKRHDADQKKAMIEKMEGQSRELMGRFNAHYEAKVNP